MNLYELLSEIRQRRLILINERECWPSPLYTPAIRQTMRRHRKELALLIAGGSIEACPNRDLYRKSWYYSGARFVCEACERFERGAQR